MHCKKRKYLYRKILFWIQRASLVVMARLGMRLLLLSLLTMNTMIFAQKKRKPIVTSLNAKWSNTPILLEVRSISQFTYPQISPFPPHFILMWTSGSWIPQHRESRLLLGVCHRHLWEGFTAGEDWQAAVWRDHQHCSRLTLKSSDRHTQVLSGP